MVSEKTAVEEESGLRDYEMVLIINPEIDEEGVNSTIENVTQFITGKGGVVSEVEQWGKRRLAYPVKHFAEGNYVLIRFKVKPDFTIELKANLEISEQVLRHLLINLSD